MNSVHCVIFFFLFSHKYPTEITLVVKLCRYAIVFVIVCEFCIVLHVCLYVHLFFVRYRN